jgi:GNAT superfamily N-acetyltransferase
VRLRRTADLLDRRQNAGHDERVPELSVRAMSESEYARYVGRTLRDYAAEHVKAGNWSEHEALERAREDNSQLLPQGYRTPGMLFLHAVRPDGVDVGVLWIGLTHPRGIPNCAWIFDIGVYEAHRGEGYGRALLAAAEDIVRERGIGALMLNVFSANTPARQLYESAGYAVIAQHMRKDVL